MIRSKTRNYLVAMLGFSLFALLLLTHFLEFPLLTTAGIPEPGANGIASATSGREEAFTDVVAAFRKWDKKVGCERFREKYRRWTPNASVLQEAEGSGCRGMELSHVSVLIKGWTWIPDNLDRLYSCRCGLSCLWTKSAVLADKPDALLFENATPPSKRKKGDPLRVYMDLEASRKHSGFEDIFIGYHAKDDVQTTYAGALFHNNRNYHVSPSKKNVGCSDLLVLFPVPPRRDQLAKSFLSLVPHHSFGKCLNNVGGLNMALTFYPECSATGGAAEDPHWYDHLHCAMSHYKFVLAIENTAVDSYVTEKLFYALDAGSVPIYFGAPNVADFVPPNSIVDGSKFSSMKELAAHVKSLAVDPVAYAEYHAWRRCGVLGNYGRVRAASLDTLPCRLCEAISSKGGKLAGNR